MHIIKKSFTSILYILAAWLTLHGITLADPPWIEDVSKGENPAMYTNVVIAGQLVSLGKQHLYRIEIRGHSASEDVGKAYLKSQPVSGRVGELCPDENQIFDSLEVYLDDKKMSVPSKAVKGVVNFDIGRPERIGLFEKNGLFFYIVFDEFPAGEGSVAYVFRDGSFLKRQLRYPHDGYQYSNGPFKNFDVKESSDF